MLIPNSLPAPLAAMRANISREALIRAAQRGELAAQVVDGRWLIDPTSLDRFIVMRAYRDRNRRGRRSVLPPGHGRRPDD